MAAYGGIERHLELLSLHCLRQGIHVTLVTTSNSLHADTKAGLLQKGIQLRELPLARETASAAIKLLWLVWTALSLRRQRWDVIYTNGQSGLAQYLWWAGSANTRRIHHHHTAGDAAEQTTWHPQYRKVLQRCSELVAVSPFTLRQLQSVLKRDGLLYLPCVTPELLPREAVVEEVRLQSPLLHFGFAGRLVSTKGIETICELSLVPELAMVRWHVHGQGDDYPETFFHAYPNVQYHGAYRDLNSYRRILEGLDAMVLFSQHSEGLPFCLMEAMAAGLPWIATDRGGTRDLAVSEKNCVVVPALASVHEMKYATLELVRRLRARETSRREQRQVYDRYFEPQTVGNRWVEYFRSGIES